jgi:hypothetical protein
VRCQGLRADECSCEVESFSGPAVNQSPLSTESFFPSGRWSCFPPLPLSKLDACPRVARLPAWPSCRSQRPGSHGQGSLYRPSIAPMVNRTSIAPMVNPRFVHRGGPWPLGHPPCGRACGGSALRALHCTCPKPGFPSPEGVTLHRPVRSAGIMKSKTPEKPERRNRYPGLPGKIHKTLATSPL